MLVLCYTAMPEATPWVHC